MASVCMAEALVYKANGCYTLNIGYAMKLRGLQDLDPYRTKGFYSFQGDVNKAPRVSSYNVFILHSNGYSSSSQ